MGPRNMRPGLLAGRPEQGVGRGNQPDPAWSGADSHQPRQRGTGYHVWEQEITLNPHPDRGNRPSWDPAAGSPHNGAGGRRCWFYSHRGNQPYSAGNDAGSPAPPRQYRAK
ncbi:uncharacterized protein ACDP82_020300 isoform 2-T5 [Pangshura tecta]